jgi:hypothetical protein
MTATAFKQVKNNALSAVAAGSTIISSTSGTAITLTTGHGVRFPQPGAGFWVTVWDAGTFPNPSDDANMEIMLATARATDVLTVTRAQLGTAAASTHAVGRRVQLLIQDQQIIDAQTAINAIEDPGAWTAFTPAWTAPTTNPTIGNGTLQGYYHKIGRTVHVRVNLTLGSTTTTGSGNWSFGLPFTASANMVTQTMIGHAYIEDSGSFAYGGDVWYLSTTTVSVLARPVAAGYASLAVIASTVPMTWGTADFTRFSYTYEAAS